jgi:hypothetical protein
LKEYFVNAEKITQAGSWLEGIRVGTVNRPGAGLPNAIFPILPVSAEDSEIEPYIRLKALPPDLEKQVREVVGLPRRDDSRHTEAE